MTSPKSPAKEMVDMLKLRIRQVGLERLKEVEQDFEAAKRLFAGLSWWPEVEIEAAKVLEKARKKALLQKQEQKERDRQYQMELERIKGSVTNISYIQQPNATSAFDNGRVDQQVVALDTANIAHTSSSS